MKNIKLTLISAISVLLVFAAVSLATSDAAGAPKKKAKAKTTASTKKTAKKSSGTSKSSAKKSTKKSTRKSKKKRKVSTISHKTYEAPPEPVLNDSLTLLVNDSVIAWIPEMLNPGGLRVNSVKVNANTKSAAVGLNENFTYLPVTAELINAMHRRISDILPDSLAGYRVALNVGTRNYAYYINKVDKLPEKWRANVPFVVPAEPYVNAVNGMKNDIVAIWPSHGRYFKPGSGAWMWQRPQLFTLSEDTNTLAFILPYVVPMLENAGAYVMLPRERDINPNEVIVDNDTNEGGQIFSQPYYREMTGSKTWETGEEEGFIYDLADFRDTENPFENGTYRQTSTVTGGSPSVAAWYADIPEDGEYAVYVSYKTLPNSTDDARYTVNYSGGTREFKVNQTMGGGTWIYLGTFPLEAGYSDTEPVVTLSNLSSKEGRVVTADAVKIGGGMGNIARSDRRSDVYFDPSTPEESISETQSGDEEEEDSENTEPADSVPEPPVADPAFYAKNGAPAFKTSGLPRYLEGARYWMHWAGMPEEIYSPYHGTDDYKDDYTNRGHWVNYLAGGSRVLPGQEGLGIPVDVTMALHSDAGKRADDSIVGTLGIYYTNGGDSYADGTPRANSRTLTDMLMRQITGDIRQTWEPNWTRRSMWDKSYVEARVPEVPTALIELLSHQNFGDMRYALDPWFRFTVSRSIYKALGRFVAERKDRKFVVQPLPVKDFAIRRLKKHHYRLSWQPTPDRLEPTAFPTRYLIMERTADELGFHLLGETKSTEFEVLVEDHDIHSFRIIAANDGGLSFESETLALREPTGHEPMVLVINAFTRVSGPGEINRDGEAGFVTETDFGVPYIRDISYIGPQTEFRRSAGEAFGRSSGGYADRTVAGNTFDFAYLHGLSIMKAGYGFVSASIGAVTSGEFKLNDYKTIDLIMGKQKTDVTGNGNTGFRFTAFPAKLQDELKSFTRAGGDLIVSGEYILSDLADYRSPDGSLDFARNVLGVEPCPGVASNLGEVRFTPNSGAGLRAGSARYSNTLNKAVYRVEKPDLMAPAPGTPGRVFMTLGEDNQAVGVLSHNGDSRTAVMTVPFETIISQNDRDSLMKGLLHYITR